MEAWQEELNCASVSGLGFDDEYCKFKKEIFLQMLDVVSD